MVEKDIRMGLKNDYDGMSKLYTKNCPECEFNKSHPITDKEACYWGIAWKYLIKVGKPRKCALPPDKSPRKKNMDGSSAEFLESITEYLPKT